MERADSVNRIGRLRRNGAPDVRTAADLPFGPVGSGRPDRCRPGVGQPSGGSDPRQRRNTRSVTGMNATRVCPWTALRGNPATARGGLPRMAPASTSPETYARRTAIHSRLTRGIGPSGSESHGSWLASDEPAGFISRHAAPSGVGQATTARVGIPVGLPHPLPRHRPILLCPRLG